MSDYLGNLAARSLGLAAVLRPRHLSRFEPPPEARPSDAFFAVREEEVISPWPQPAEPTEGPVSPLAPPAREHSQEARRPATDRPDLVAVPPSPRPSPAPPGGLPERPPAAEEQPPSRAAPQAPAPSGLFADQPPPTPVPHPAPAPSLAAGRESATAPPIDREQPRRLPHGPAASSVEDKPLALPKQPATLPLPLSEPSSPPERTPAPAVLVAAPTTVTPALRFQPSAPVAAPPAVSPEPAPVIRVTIGRIEVRAVPPPAPSAPKVTPPPRLSLEEYLRGQARSQGGTR